MHELAIAQSIVEMLDERAQTCHARRVKNVRLCIGEANGVVIASLTFCFEMLTSLNPSLTGAQLVIDTRPHRAYCRSCHKEFPVIHFVAQCPCVNNGAATSFPAPNFGSLKWKSKHRSKVEAMPKVMIAQHILAANETIAQELRQDLTTRGIHTLNLMSSPGAGKTTLLERTIERLREQLGIAVIEGDIETSADAERIEAAGVPTVQINTRGACHLEAHMLRDALASLNLACTQLLIVENIGNLVCPSTWDLGEDLRVVIVSTTEGDDKPAKYPHMFATSQVMIINKLDLLPYVDYDLTKVRQQATAINPHLQIFEMSCRTGEGLDAWYRWLLAFTRQGNLSSATGS